MKTMGNLEYKNYLGSVEFSESDQVFYGRVQGVRALISYEGETLRDLREDFRAAVDDYLSSCEARGTEPELGELGKIEIKIEIEAPAMLEVV